MTVPVPWVIPRLIPIAAVVFGVSCSTDADAEPTADDLKYGAFDVCTQFVEERLRSPGSAEFPNEFEDDGEVTFEVTGQVHTVRSHVDAENGFGAMLRSEFTCQVEHIEGERYRLVDLDLVEG